MTRRPTFLLPHRGRRRGERVVRRQIPPRLVSSLLRGGQVAQLVEHRTENPGVGGSIPSLPTIVFPPDFDNLPRLAGPILSRVGLATRPELDPRRFASANRTTVEAGHGCVSWRICS